METRLEEGFLREVVHCLQQVHGGDMVVSAAKCCVDGQVLTGVIGRVPGRRIVPVVYLKDIPAGVSAEKAADSIAQKFHTMLTGRPVQMPPGRDGQAVLAEVILRAAGRRAVRLTQRDSASVSRGGIVGLFYIPSRDAYLSKGEQKELDTGMDELFVAACKNTLAQFGVVLANTSEFSSSLPADTILQSEPFSAVRFDPQSLYVLTNDAPTGGAALMLMPPVLEELGRIVDGDYHITPINTREVMISGTTSMFSPKILAALLRNGNQKTKGTSGEGVLSDFVFRYDCNAKRLVTIQQ